MLVRVLKRIAGTVLAGMLILPLTSTPLFAQETAPYCAQLEAADCALISTSAAAMQDVESLETTSSVNIRLVDIPSMPFDEFTLDYTQRSAFSIDPDAMDLLNEIKGMTTAELEQMMSNPVDAFAFVETLITSMNMALEMDLELSDGVLALINEEVRAELGVDLPADLGFQLRFIDGIIYVDLTTVAALVPEVGMFVQGWVGVDSAPLFQMARSEMAAAGIDESTDLSDTSQLDENPFAAMSMNQSGPLITVVDSIDPTGEASTYLNIEREVNESTDVATFRTTLDYDEFMQSNAFRELVYAIMTNEGASVSAEELDETVTLAQMMVPAFLQDLELELTEEIAQESGYMLGGELLLDWDLKSILTLAAQGDPSLQMEADASPNLTFSSSTINDKINEEITVEVPEGAFVVPMEMLMALMNS